MRWQAVGCSALWHCTIYNGESLPITVADGAATLNAAGVPTSAAHTISYAYDLYDRLTTTTYADGTQEVLTLDNDGEVTQRTNRGNLTTKYVYDSMHRVTSETDQSFSAPFTYTYDLVARPLTVTYSAGTFTYATAGRQAQTTRPDGLVINYGYMPTATPRPSPIRTAGSTATPMTSWTA